MLIFDLSGNGCDGIVDCFVLIGIISNWVESYVMAILKNIVVISIMDNGFIVEWLLIDNGIVE